MTSNPLQSCSPIQVEEVPGLVSVVIPAHNHGLFLPETLDSVLAQTYPDIEVILIDDDSSDNTPQIAEQYTQKFRPSCFHYVRLSHVGAAGARNEGLLRSRGEFLQYLDADDLLDPHKLSLQVQFFREHQNVDISVGQVCYFVNPEKLSDPIELPAREYTLESFVCEGHFITMAPLSRRTSLFRIGLWNTSLRYGDESEYFGRAVALGVKVVDQPDAICHYRIHMKNGRRVIGLENMIRTVAMSYDRILQTGRENGVEISPAMEMKMLEFRWLVHVFDCERKEAIRDLQRLIFFKQPCTGQNSEVETKLRTITLQFRLLSLTILGVGVWLRLWKLFHALFGSRIDVLPESVRKEIREVMFDRYGRLV